MTDRLSKIFAVLPCADTFADIGCDHGYIAKAMLDEKKCKRAIISDISEKCLSKAQTLLSDYIEKGIVESAVSNGFDNISACDLCLIAGMGGEEICDILIRANSQNKLPKTMVLQPMKNCEKVRLTLLSLGYKFTLDKVFKSGGKFYNLMLLEKGEDSLTEREIMFGRDNLKLLHQDFKDMMAYQMGVYMSVLDDEKAKKETKESVKNKIDLIKDYV